MTKMVINKRFGGFRLSAAAHNRLGSVWVDGDVSGYWDTSPWDEGLDDFTPAYRSLPALVAVVELFCEEANGRYAYLKVVDVPDDAEVYISEYDGKETVREVHRMWG